MQTICILDIGICHNLYILNGMEGPVRGLDLRHVQHITLALIISCNFSKLILANEKITSFHQRLRDCHEIRTIMFIYTKCHVINSLI